MNSVLSVENLSVNYGSHVALDSLTMDIQAGEIVGLIGPNGAGKTSFIKALCGRTPDWSGEISISGVNLKSGSDRRALIGLVPQDIGLYSHLSAMENLHTFARLMRLPKSQAAERAHSALSAVDLLDKANTRVANLSGGMKRRINVAGAIMHDPKLLILDEPTAGVDLPARDTIHKQARKLADSGLAILLVTHELEQAEAICNRILLLSEGRKLAFGTPEKVLDHVFKGVREVAARFSHVPDDNLIKTLQRFAFKPSQIATVWTTLTRKDETAFVTAFMTAITGYEKQLRELSLRQPGLATLMQYIEKHRSDTC